MKRWWIFEPAVTPKSIFEHFAFNAELGEVAPTECGAVYQYAKTLILTAISVNLRGLLTPMENSRDHAKLWEEANNESPRNTTNRTAGYLSQLFQGQPTIMRNYHPPACLQLLECTFQYKDI